MKSTTSINAAELASLDSLDRDGLKKFILSHNLKGKVKIYFSTTEEQIREKILQAVKDNESVDLPQNPISAEDIQPIKKALDTTTKATTTKAAAPKKGVISCIKELIESNGPITKSEILEALKIEFPERKESSMRNTIQIQVPNRLNKEKGMHIVLTDKGYVNTQNQC